MSSHPMEPQIKTEERVSIRVVEYANYTYTDSKYGELRSYAVGGGWDDTPKSIERAEQYAAEQRARHAALDMDWTVEVVRETYTTTYTTVREALV